jgi:hypothetical protein
MTRTDALRTALLAEREPASCWSHEIHEFLQGAAGCAFEMRFFGEDRWYRTSADDVAHTLVPYHPDLIACLDRLRAGESLASWLALYRVASYTLRR